MSGQAPGLGALKIGMALGVLVLGGCEALAPQPEAASGGALRIEEREVERPDVFSFTGQGIWGGGPTLGGQSWVAVAGAPDGNQVRVTNLDNGRTTTASLFPKQERPERPPIEVSDQAAEALGMAGNEPARLEIVALVREVVEIADPAAAEGTAADAAAPEPVADEALETTVLAAIVAAEAETETETEAEAENGASGSAAPAAAAGATAAVAATAPAPAATPAPTATPAPPAAPAAAAPAGPQPERAYIQVATAATEGNAEALVSRLEGDGLSAEVRTTTVGSRTLYPVVVGPAESEAARDALLADLKDKGFADAFPTR